MSKDVKIVFVYIKICLYHLYNTYMYALYNLSSKESIFPSLLLYHEWLP